VTSETRSEVEQLLQQARDLPLYDAAFLLWVRRHDAIWRKEHRMLTEVGVRDAASSLARFRRDLALSYLRVTVDRVLGHRQGETFDRLRTAHADASVPAIGAAIRAAHDLEDYASKHVSDVRSLVASLPGAHPGFLAETYDRAWQRAAFLSR